MEWTLIFHHSPTDKLWEGGSVFKQRSHLVETERLLRMLPECISHHCAGYRQLYLVALVNSSLYC